MKVSFYLIVSFFDKKNKSEKFSINVKRGIYMKARKRLFVVDRKKNKKGKTFSMRKAYPIIKVEKTSYVVYGAMKKIRIEDVIPLDIQNSVLR